MAYENQKIDIGLFDFTNFETRGRSLAIAEEDAVNTFNPLIAASKGWHFHKKGSLICDDCKSKIFYHMPENALPSSRKKIRRIFYKKMADGHSERCYWRDGAEVNLFEHYLSVKFCMGKIIHDLEDRVLSWEEVEFIIDEKFLKGYLTKDVVGKDVDVSVLLGIIDTAAKLIAAFGWEQSISAPDDLIFAECNYCHSSREFHLDSQSRTRLKSNAFSMKALKAPSNIDRFYSRGGFEGKSLFVAKSSSEFIKASTEIESSGNIDWGIFKSLKKVKNTKKKKFEAKVKKRPRDFGPFNVIKSHLTYCPIVARFYFASGKNGFQMIIDALVRKRVERGLEILRTYE